MKVLAVGGGGREHAMVQALGNGEARIFAAMKNRNPGIARASEEFKLIKETDVEKVVDFATDSGVEMAVIGPEAPLEAGLVDALESKGISCVGPTRAAARIETSKSFMRDLMDRHGIPGNLDFRVFEDFREAKGYAEGHPGQLAVKPVGLTGGKGVKIEGEHLQGKEEVVSYIRDIFDQGIGGKGVVLEEKASGEEFTLQALCDGRTLVPMPVVQDHKRAWEGDKGPNTGGMGSYSMQDHSLPFMTVDEYSRAIDIMHRTVRAMADDGHPYVGILYGQFMLTRDGPRVIEYNARFGDPEAMNVLPILDSDFLELCGDMVDGDLVPARASFDKKATVCKYVVPQGYGAEPLADAPVQVDEGRIAQEGAHLFYASVDERDGQVYTTTSRSLAVVGVESSLEEAERACERGLSHVKGDVYIRHDIGKPSLLRKREEHMREIRE
ncbi:MAG: phosphoribosylamine--glycine ligase [Methanomassiliicoccales archaeon]